VNCRGYNAYGRRKRREITDESHKPNKSVARRSIDDDLSLEGSLREEITISSNAILTFERRDGRYSNSDNRNKYFDDSKKEISDYFLLITVKPAAQRVEDICVSMIGLIIALIITALLAVNNLLLKLN
jgi:hypothetical protein